MHACMSITISLSHRYTRSIEGIDNGVRSSLTINSYIIDHCMSADPRSLPHSHYYTVAPIWYTLYDIALQYGTFYDTMLQYGIHVDRWLNV